MRKLIAIFALTLSLLATASTTWAGAAPPDCGDSCPWVR